MFKKIDVNFFEMLTEEKIGQEIGKIAKIYILRDDVKCESGVNNFDTNEWFSRKRLDRLKKCQKV